MTILADLAESAAWRWLADIPLRRHLAADPDAPVPFTLTAKASGFLARTMDATGLLGEPHDPERGHW